MNRKITALILSGIIGIAAIAGVTYYLKQKQETSDGYADSLKVTSQDGVAITNMKFAEDGESSGITVTYSSTGIDDLQEKYLNYSLTWSDEDNDEFEYIGWGNGKDPEDYISYTNDFADHTLTFLCKKAFGVTAVFRMWLSYESNMVAQINLDYVRRQLDDPVGEFKEYVFRDGEAPKFVWSYPSYSVGSTNEEDVTGFEVKTDFYGDRQAWYDLVNWNDMENLGGPFRYHGMMYDDGNELLTDMFEYAISYLCTIPSISGSKKYSEDTLMDIMTFEVIQDDDTYKKDSDRFEEFAYNFDRLDGSDGIFTMVYYNDEEISSGFMNMEFTDFTMMGDLKVSNNNIEF